MSTRREDVEKEYNKSLLEIVINSFQKLVRSFLTAFGIKTALSLVFHLVSLARSSPKSLLSLSKVIDDKKLDINNSLRWGFFVGGFSGGFTRNKKESEKKSIFLLH